MGLLEALQEIKKEGLVKRNNSNCGLCSTSLLKTGTDGSRLQSLFIQLGKETDFPISVVHNVAAGEQYTAVYFDENPEYNNEYLAQRWYLLHQLINELELQ